MSTFFSRISALAILAFAIILTATPASAQNYSRFSIEWDGVPQTVEAPIRSIGQPVLNPNWNGTLVSPRFNLVLDAAQPQRLPSCGSTGTYTEMNWATSKCGVDRLVFQSNAAGTKCQVKATLLGYYKNPAVWPQAANFQDAACRFVINDQDFTNRVSTVIYDARGSFYPGEDGVPFKVYLKPGITCFGSPSPMPANALQVDILDADKKVVFTSYLRHEFATPLLTEIAVSLDLADFVICHATGGRS